MNENIKIKLGKDIIKPDIWTVCCADSGEGKSYTKKAIAEIITSKEKIEFSGSGAASAARWVAELSTNSNTLWIEDEFSEFIKRMSSQKHMYELRDYLLRLYSNDDIVRKIKDKENSIVVKNPALTILGLTQGEKLFNQISSNDLIDGFLQRFNYIIAMKDSTRSMIDFPLYRLKKRWGPTWEKIKKQIVHKTYIISTDGIKKYEEIFNEKYVKKIDKSFYRRIMWSLNKYSLIYHILTNKGKEKYISEKSYGWSKRIISLHINDLGIILSQKEIGVLAKKYNQVEKYINKYKEKNNDRLPKIRNIISGIRSIKSAGEASLLLRMYTE